MKLFTKEIDSKLFEQYKKGSDLENQKVVAKIFNPYGRGTWYLLNSDPQDPDYIWAIVDFFEVEMGSVSRSELQGIKVPPFGLGLERDMSFTPINAKELFEGLLNGEHYKDGGIMLDKDFTAIEKEYKENEDNNAHSENVVLLAENFGTEEEKEEAKEILEKHNEEGSLSSQLRNRRSVLEEKLWDKYQALKKIYANGGQTTLFGDGGNVAEQNKEMLKNQAKEFMHHSQELNELVGNVKEVDAWVVAKAERATTDLSDITHYLEGRMAKGGMMAQGGELVPYIVWTSKDGDKREFFEEFKSQRSAKIKADKLWETGEYEAIGYKPKSSYEKEGLYGEGGMMAKGGMLKAILVHKEFGVEYYKNGSLIQPTKQEKLKWEVYGLPNDVEKIEQSFETTIDEFVGKTKKEIQSKSDENIRSGKYNYLGTNPNLNLIFDDKMAMGGATFKDKVNAISKRLEGKKVPTRLKKDYGATYDKKEAKQAGQRIAGSMLQKIKMRKK
jgi:hypothetical protein